MSPFKTVPSRGESRPPYFAKALKRVGSTGTTQAKSPTSLDSLTDS